MNSETLNPLILKYQAHLQAGQANLRELELSGKVYSPEYQCQRSIVSVWKLILKDLTHLTDKSHHEDIKKRI